MYNAIQVTRLNNLFEALIFKGQPQSREAIVYLHGSGSFGKGATGVFEYEDFPSLLLRRELAPDMHFITLCALQGEVYPFDATIRAVNQLREMMNLNWLHLVGFSRGGAGVYGCLELDAGVDSATTINARVPARMPSSTIPLHVIYSDEDDRVDAEDVSQFFTTPPENIKVTRWSGDHYSVADIARSGLVLDWINKLPRRGK